MKKVKLTKTQEAEVLRDFRDWSGGHEPSECSGGEIETYLGTSLIIGIDKGAAWRFLASFNPEVADFEVWTIRCKSCNLYVEHGIDECDSCLLARHGLSNHVTYDALDHLCLDELIPQDQVVKALRAAERRGA